MTLTIKIALDNAAFDAVGETARILRRLAEQFQNEPDRQLPSPIRLMDLSGNTVGWASVEED